MILLAVSMALVFTAVLTLNMDTIKKRLSQEHDTFAATLSLDLTNVPRSSFGARIHLGMYGYELVKERPILGWGPGSKATYFIADLKDNHTVKGYDHLHNTYLEVLVRIGIVGAALLGLTVWLVLRSLWRGHRSGVLPHDLFLFMAGSFSLMAVWCITDFHLDKPDFRFYWILFAGIAYSFALRGQHVSRPVGPDHKKDCA
jgi:O-antigen ligase